MLPFSIAQFSLEQISAWSISLGFKLLAGGITLIIGWYVTKLAVKGFKKLLLRSKIDAGAVGFIASVLRVILWIITLITALDQLGVNINSMVAALGAAGLTASFALKGSLGNFVSGMQVIFSKPFGVGDFLSVDVHMGTVKNIDVLNTTLVTPDNKEIIIPNALITSEIVVNFTAQKERRLDLNYWVSYQVDTAKPKALLQALVAESSLILKDPAPIIAVGEHGPNGVQIVARLWCKAEEYWDAYFEMQEAVKYAFDAHGIPIPYPQLDVHTQGEP